MCLAGWKEGSKHYLVGELVRQHVHSQEQLYRCFIYEPQGKAGARAIRYLRELTHRPYDIKAQFHEMFDLVFLIKLSQWCY